jgi:predicted HicB family RNase H-like nuclease
MNALGPYKGYIGSLDYNSDDKILHGRIQFIQDIITYEAESSLDIEAAFEEAVDEYLEDCETLGVSPDKSLSGSFNVRINPELHKKIAINSKLLDISLNQYISQALDHYVSHGENLSKSINDLNHSIDDLNDCVVTIMYQSDTQKIDTSVHEPIDISNILVN